MTAYIIAGGITLMLILLVIIVLYQNRSKTVPIRGINREE